VETAGAVISRDDGIGSCSKGKSTPRKPMYAQLRLTYGGEGSGVPCAHERFGAGKSVEGASSPCVRPESPPPAIAAVESPHPRPLCPSQPRERLHLVAAPPSEPHRRRMLPPPSLGARQQAPPLLPRPQPNPFPDSSRPPLAFPPPCPRNR